jgi:transposase
MRRDEKATRRPQLHAVKVPDEPKASPPLGPDVPGPATKAPDSEVEAAPRRRRFTAEFKRQVLAEADAAKEPGEIGALLRRHGLYSSHLVSWRRQRDEGALAGLAPRKRGRKAAPVNPLGAEVARLERELRRALARAQRAEGLVELQKKMAALLGEEIPSEEELFEAKAKGLPIPPWRKKGTR